MIIDIKALVPATALILLFWFLKRRKKAFKEGTALHSSLEDFIVTPPPLRSRLEWIPKVFYFFSSLFLLLAFLDPHEFEPKKRDGESLRDPTEGRVIFLALDQSSSMNEEKKIELMKAVTENFVQERSRDLIGLVSFARTVKIWSPPTLDHEEILKELSSLQTVSRQDQDGTAIGYAIYKTANLIASLKEQTALMGKKAPYTIQGSVVIVVTDGLQDPNPLDKDNPYRSMELEQAAGYAKEKGVRVYVINIEPKWGSTTFLPNLKQMKRIAEMTGGKFYHASSSSDLPDFVNDINDLEASTFYSSRLPTSFKKVSYYPVLLSFAFFFFFAGAILDETIFRRSPC